MATDISIQSLFPSVQKSMLSDPNQTTFVGIDFGTSTTVASIAFRDSEGIQVVSIWLNQKLADGTLMSSEKVPTVIAWYNQNLLIGKGAADLKYQLKKGKNVWYSFKMELGEDVGAKYFNSELGQNSPFPLLNPKDATKLFFQYLKAQVDRYIKQNNLPNNVQYAVSIPASFEANQRKELIEALAANGISLNKQALIDEPNAAFLSFVQATAQAHNPLILPDGDNSHVLVFDFGAGTGDVSILELGKDINGIYSNNLSISKFERLGGDDIDLVIATNYLFPQLLIENNQKEESFRTPEKKRIINQLLKFAEQLKIQICERVALQMNNFQLSELATSIQVEHVNANLTIDTRKGKLFFSQAKLSYVEFDEVMALFLRQDTTTSYHSDDKVNSIFSPINTALEKANLDIDQIDYVLFIGGSSKNPYVQAKLKEYFDSSDLLVPRELQTHVSAGAAIHSLIYNGFGKNIIQPITSEPLLVITKENLPKVILRAGTHIPCEKIVIDDLVTQVGQKAIELPICLGNVNKMLYNIKITSDDLNGFEANTSVKLEIEINADKLLIARASISGKTVSVEPMNPFANKELSSEERIVLTAEREANLQAVRNGGKPTEKSLRDLVDAHRKIGNYLRAAETLELLNEIYPNKNNLNEIGYLYSCAGFDSKQLEYFKKAYILDRNATTAFNYAYVLRFINKEKSKDTFKDSIAIDPNKAHSLYELGKILEKECNPEGHKMIKKAFDIFNERYQRNRLKDNDYGWFSSIANHLGYHDLADEIISSRPDKTLEDRLYNRSNLTSSKFNSDLVLF